MAPGESTDGDTAQPVVISNMRVPSGMRVPDNSVAKGGKLLTTIDITK
jgi:hypothetical protein